MKDTVDFGEILYQEERQSSTLLVNEESSAIELCFNCNSSGFSVYPQQCRLTPGNTQEVRFTCKGVRLGQLSGEVWLQINGIPAQKIRLEADVTQLKLHLEPEERIGFCDTLVTQSTTAKLVVKNCDQRPASVHLKQFPMCTLENGDPDFENPAFEFLVKHARLYPEGQVEFQCTFTPGRSGMYSTTVYIESDGRLNRIPVKLEANATAPEVSFDVDLLDFQKVTIGASSQICFELLNHSVIQVEFRLMNDVSKDEIGAPLVKFSQNEGIVPARAAISLNCVVTPQKLGRTLQTSKFYVLGRQEPLTLEVVIETIAPQVKLKNDLDLVEVDVPEQEAPCELNFGTVPYGFSQQKELHVFNMAPVSQAYILKIEPSKNHDDTTKNIAERLLVASDFNVVPEKVVLGSKEHQTLSVSLLAKHAADLNSYRGFVLNCYSKCCAEPLAQCQLQAAVINAKFSLTPQMYRLTPCYIGVAHTINVRIQNVSPVLGRWLFPPQDQADQCIITCSEQTGVLAAAAYQDLECKLIPRGAGDVVAGISFVSDVGNKEVLQCMVTFTASKPDISSSVDAIRFTGAKLLEKQTKSFKLNNMGLSDARIQICAAKPGSFFTVAPEYQDFVLRAQSQREIQLDFTANVAGMHSDQLIIHFGLTNTACEISEEVRLKASEMLKLKLQGEAKGTSLVCPDQDFTVNPNVDCGLYFTTEQLIKKIKIENHGQDQQTLTWSQVQSKTSSDSFLTSVENNKIMLEPGQFVIFIFTARCGKPTDLRTEQWMLRTNIQGRSTDTAFTINLTYRFVQSQVELFNEDNTRIAIEKNTAPLKFEHVVFPIFGALDTFFGQDHEQHAEYVLQDNAGNDYLYKKSLTSRRIKIRNSTPIGTRIQLIVSQEFQVHLIGDKSDLVEKFALTANEDTLQQGEKEQRVFESFLLSSEGAEQVVEVSVSEELCDKDSISKEITGMLQIRLMPIDQNPQNPPTIKIPLHVVVRYPSVEFRSCNEQEYQGHWNQAPESYFAQLNPVGAIDFGSTIPGTPINQYIFVRNTSLFPIQMGWEITQLKQENCTFDISPSEVRGGEGVNPGQIVMFTCKFLCDAGEKPTMKLSNISAICCLFGGPAYEYKVSAQISNLAVDVTPSHVNLSEISFCSEQPQSFFVQNVSEVATTFQVRVPKECLPFIKKLNDEPLTMNSENTWNFPLAGGQKREIRMVFAPRVPGRFYVPVYIRIGHLEELLIPVTGTAVVEQVALLCEGVRLKRADDIMPWACDVQFPKFSAFLKAAYTFQKSVPQLIQTASSLQKEVQPDGSIIHNGTLYEVRPEVVSEESWQGLFKHQDIVTLADELVQTQVELYKARNTERTSKIVSKVRSRQEQARRFTYINESPFQVIRTLSELPKYPFLFIYNCSFAPCSRMQTTQQNITLVNTGTLPLSPNLDRRYYFPYGITIEPEKIYKLPQGESVQLTISYTPAGDQQLGPTRFLMPLIFRSGGIGLINCQCNVTVPTIKPMNLMLLAKNFSEFPVMKNSYDYTLHFGKCLFGRALRFSVILQNPSDLPATFSCDAQGGSTVPYELDSRAEIDPIAKLQNKLDDLFTIQMSNGTIQPHSEIAMTVQFKPKDCFAAKFKQGCVFRGELKFIIKTGQESVQKLPILLVGIGYHPLIKVSSSLAKVPAVFPKEISQQFASILIENEGPEATELFIPEFDQAHLIEKAVLDALTINDGTMQIKRTKAGTTTTHTAFFSEFAGPGEVLSEQLAQSLSQQELHGLNDFMQQSYEQFLQQATIVSKFFERKNPKEALNLTEAERASSRPRTAVSTIASRLEAREKDHLVEFEVSFDPEDFSYQPTEEERNQLKYGRACESIQQGKSFRIHADDDLFSSLPFLFYMVHGAPLSGKSALCRHIQAQFSLNGRTIPIITIDQILGEEPETYKRFQKSQEEQNAATLQLFQKKGGKGPAPTVDPLAFLGTTEYVEELAKEFCERLDNFFVSASEQYVKVGLIIDGLFSRFVRDVEQFSQFFTVVLRSLLKRVRYEKQVPTARLAFYPIITDISPKEARQRQIEYLLQMQREAQRDADNAGTQEEKATFMAKAQELTGAMIDARQCYDTEDKNAEANKPLTEGLKFINQHYSQVFADSDDLGKKQKAYLITVPRVDAIIQHLHAALYEIHKEVIKKELSAADKSPEELAYDEVEAQLKAAEDELQNTKKGNLKLIQQKYDELTAKLAECTKALPPSPVEKIPQKNLFQFIGLWLPEEDAVEMPTVFNANFTENITRYTASLSKFVQVQLKAKAQQAGAQRNQRVSVLEELLVHQAVNAEDFGKLKEHLQNKDSELSVILTGSKDMKSVMAEAYKALPDEKTQLYQPGIISSEFMEFYEGITVKRDELRKEIDAVTPQAMKGYSKQQLQDLQDKKKEVKELDDQLKAKFGATMVQIESANGRWIIPANGKKMIYFRLLANKIHQQKTELTLQARTSELKIPITLDTQCDWPHIVDDWSRILPQGKGYSQAQKALDFGTIRAAVPVPEIFTRPLTPADQITNQMNFTEIAALMQEKGSSFLLHHFRPILLENNSVFPAKVALALDTQLNGERPQTGLKRIMDDGLVEDVGKKQEKKAPPKPEKGKQAMEVKPPCFGIFPQKVQLAPGERCYVFLTAFPEAVGSFTQQLFVGVEHNPDVLQLNLKCTAVTLSVKHTVPECPLDLVPMSKSQPELQEMSNRLMPQASDLGTARDGKKPAAQPKGKDAKKEAPGIVTVLNIPRISLKHQNIAELQVQNTSELPLEVLYEPCFKEEQIQSFQEQFKLAENARSYRNADIVTKTTNQRGAQLVSTVYAVKNKFLLVQNTRFVLKPGDSGAIRFEFGSKDCVQLIYPGRLLIRQAALKQECDVCAIETLKAFKDLYRTPIVNQPVIVAAEAHCVDAFISVTSIEQTENRIPPKDFQIRPDVPNQTINLGTCKAMTHFQAEVTFTNNGMYRVSYDIDILKAFQSQLKIVKFAAPEPAKPPTPSKGKPRAPAPQQQEQVRLLVTSISGTLEPCPEPVIEERKPEAAAKKDKKPSRSNSRANAPSPVMEKVKLGPNQTMVSFDFYAVSTQELQNQPAACITFSDPTTKQLLIKTSINLTAKVKFSELSISPDRALVFGDFAHGKQPIKAITVENIGLFPTSCTLEPLQQTIKRYIMTGQVSQYTQEYEAAYAALPYDKTKLAANGFYVDVNDTSGRPATPNKAKQVKKDKAPVEVPSQLALGPYTLSPCSFQLKPGQKQQVQIVFNAIGTLEYKEFLAIDYSNRLMDRPQGTILTEQIISRLDEQLVKEFQKLPDFLQTFKYKREMLGDFANAPTIRYTVSANSQIPGFSVEPNDLYEEQQIVNQAITDPIMITEGAQYSILANQLCFGSCQLNNAMKERIRFYNPFMVETNIAVFITTRQEPLEQLMQEFVGDGMQKVQQFIEAALGKRKIVTSKQAPVRSKSGDKKKQEQFKGENLILNDDDAWVIDRNYIQVLPQESQYVTITYKPTQQVQSRARIIAASLDTWMRVGEQLKKNPPQKGEKGDPEKALHTQLVSYFSDENRRNVQMDLRLLAVGVLPEVVLGPKQIVLKDVLVNQIDGLDVQQIYIRNMGRVPCKFSLQIRAASVEDGNYFGFTPEGSDVVPENRLFTGLKEVKPGATMTFGVTACLQGKMPAETQTVEARVVANILTGDDQFSGLDIPMRLTLVKATVCLQQKHQEIDKQQDRFLCDVVQTLFTLPLDAPTSQITAAQYLSQMPESAAFQQFRATLISQLNLLQDKPDYKQQVILNDGVQTDQGTGETYAVLYLVNQSQQTQRFEIDADQCAKLAIQVVPNIGHINPGTKSEIRVKLIQPPELQEVQADKGKSMKKGATQAAGGAKRNILFGNPLLIKITPIQLKKHRAQAWDNSQKVHRIKETGPGDAPQMEQDAFEFKRMTEPAPEPEFDVTPNPHNLMRLQKEWDDFQLLQQNKKAKLTQQQQNRLAFLQRLVENRQSVEFQLMVASSYIEADLFGCFDCTKLKLHFRNADGQFQALPMHAQGTSQFQLVELPFGELPILQRSKQEFLVSNEGLAAPTLEFVATQNQGFFMDAPRRVFPRPDLFAAAVKEQYQAICEIPAVVGDKDKKTKAPPVDKNYAATVAAKFSALETSPYAAKFVVSYEPRIPGVYDERFTSHQAGLQLRCFAKATLPLCHIECPETDYLETQRPASTLTPQVFSNLLAQNVRAVKCLAIPSCGVGSKAFGSLTILNTVAQGYDIELKRLPESTQKIQTSISEYQIASGEKLQIKFTYDCDRSSLKTTAEEAFYMLRIPQFDIQIPLLIVGLPKDPDVSINTNKVNFGAVGYGEQRQLEISLINRERSGFNYRIKPVQGLFDIKITPTQGIIPANGSTTVLLTCTPLTECKVSQVVQIEVARKSLPLQLNVKYECFKSRHQLELLPENEQVGIATAIQSTYDLDLGSVFLADSKRRVFKLTNVGQADVYFGLELRLDRAISTARKDQMELRKCTQNIELTVENAELKENIYLLQAHQAALINVAFIPKDVITMDKQFGLSLYIKTPGQGFQRINILGRSMRPGLHASATELDFGIVVADLAPEKCKVKTLRLINQDRLPLNLEYISESTDFCILTPPLIEPLKPGEHVDVDIRFQPVFAQQFSSALAVTVNGLYKLKYLLYGTSVHHNFTTDSKVLQVGQILIRSQPSFKLLPIRNNSLASINVRVELDKEQEMAQGLFYTLVSPEHQADIVTKALEMIQAWDTRLMKQRYLQDMPKTIAIPPNQFASIAAFYLPLKRQQPFRLQGNLIIEECQTLEKFFYVEGAGIGASVKLLSQSVDLPPCLVGSFVQSTFQLENIGDVPVTFSIEAPPRNLAKKAVIQMFETGVLSIKPLQATIQPGQLMNVQVRFAPPADMKPQRIEVPPIPVTYELSGQKIQLGEFTMSCTAESTQQFNSTSTNAFSFECAARGQDQQQARIENATATPFEVKTVLQGHGARHFRVPDRLVIPPGGLDFQIVYKPMAQTVNGPHEAQLIIASPEGGANIYNLSGQASAPQLDGLVANTTVQKPASASNVKKPATPDKKKPKAKGPVAGEPTIPMPVTDNVIQISDKIAAYKQTQLRIPLQNWETSMQRFIISHEFFDQSHGALCRFGYPQFVDVAPNSPPRVVEITFTPFALVTFSGYLIFKNEGTGEFLKFQFALECNTLEPLQKLFLETSVRDIVSKHVSIPNLFGKNGFFIPKCARQDVQFGEERAKLSAKAVSAPMKINFKPLVPCQNVDCVLEFEATLVDEGVETKLANMQFMLQLTANPPRPSSPIKIQADQGKTLNFQINLKNETRDRLVFNTALTQLTDIQDLYKQLTTQAPNAQAQPQKGKVETGIADGRRFYQSISQVSIVAPVDVVCDGNKGFIVNLLFQPKQIGEYHTNVVIFNKTGGIWVIPILGKCTRPPALGSITFE